MRRCYLVQYREGDGVRSVEVWTEDMKVTPIRIAQRGVAFTTPGGNRFIRPEQIVVVGEVHG